MNKILSIWESLFTKFSILPVGVPAKYYRWFVFCNYGCLISLTLHIIFLCVFIWFQILTLAIFNVGSVILFISCISLNFKGYLKASIVLITFEVTVHQILATIFLGWEAGFHYYLLALVLVLYFTPWKAYYLKATTVVIIFIIYLLLMYYIKNNFPIVLIEESVLYIFNLANIFGIFFIFTSYGGYYNNAAATAEEALEKEQKISESLLYNILPVPIANRLRKDTSIIADSVEESTILFADIVGFTVFSEQVLPRRLVEILNDIFSQFDNLSDKYGVEKIKTIGDAYMVVSGIPEHRDDHASVIAAMALEMKESLKSVNKKFGKEFNIRIGINSGPVVAGVIGKKKFAYDLWGDSVNTASRMESHGIPGEIQVTQTTYILLKNKFYFEERGEINIKGKGIMNTYLLKGIINNEQEIDSYIDLADNPQEILRDGISFIKNKMYHQALINLNKVISIDSSIKEAYYYRALTNQVLGNKNVILSDIKTAANLGHLKSINVLQKIKKI